MNNQESGSDPHMEDSGQWWIGTDCEDPLEHEVVEVKYSDGSVSYITVPTKKEIEAIREFSDRMFRETQAFFGPMMMIDEEGR